MAKQTDDESDDYDSQFQLVIMVHQITIDDDDERDGWHGAEMKMLKAETDPD